MAAAGVGLWLWVESLGHVEADPALVAGPPVRSETGVVHPDFRGEWKIDLASSESLAPILRAKGKSAVEVAVLSRVPITHIITGDHRQMTVRVKTPLFDRTEVLPLDGTLTHVADPEGNPAEATTRWSEDGQSIVTVTEQPSLRVTITRSLDPDRRTMYLDLKYHFSKQDPICVRRVFRLIGLPAGAAKN
jgi:hypothetical protein